MKSEEELGEYYEKELLPSLKELNSKRKKTLLLLFGFCVFQAILAVFVFGFVLAIFWVENPMAVCCFPFPPIIWLIIFALGISKIKGSYVKDYKTQVMPKVVKYIDSGLEYAYSKTIPQSEFTRSQLFLTHPDSYSGEDHISGVVGKTQVQFSEVHAQEKRETRDSKGHRHTHYVTIFKGVFFIADFNKSFKERTLVLPDSAEKMFGKVLGGFLQSKNITRPPLVKLEDPEFEKYFVVYSKDQVEARYVLSPSLMQRITEFRKKTNKSIYLSFVDDKLMVAIPYGKNLFEPRLFRSIVDPNQINEYYKTIELVIGIVDDLNLNTRIWSKS